MLELVIRSHIIAERLKNLFLDTRKSHQWSSVACFLLMLTSISFTPFSLNTIYTYVELQFFLTMLYRFHELRDALEKLQLNDAALKVWVLLSND